ncbi:VOC family protein [Halobacillus mangrovi]|uniref:VOC family protein n=1 Tax=Halobacillus mangrovi TaxID=402384 RepID=UPI003D963889
MIVGIHPYLILDGRGQEAIKFYEEAVEAEILNVQTFGEMPSDPENPIPDELKDRVMNAHMKVGGTDLMLSDTHPDQPYQLGQQLSIAIIIKNVEKSREVLEKLREGGSVDMELQETFWSAAYGQVTDKFGVLWQVNTISE